MECVLTVVRADASRRGWYACNDVAVHLAPRAPLNKALGCNMKRFYVFWFFFAAGWGYLIAEPLPPGFAPRSIPMAFASFPVGTLTVFLILAIELWRLGPNKKALPPSLTLKPWTMPFGMVMFVLMTFLFASTWGILFSMLRVDGQITEPLHFFCLSVGGLVGIWSVFRALPSRFAA
jgi:hypothetical protein